MGFSYAVPDSIVENQDQEFLHPTAAASRYILNFNQRDNTYLFGPSIAGSLGVDRLTWGLTLYGHYRNWELTNNQWVEYSTGATLQDNYYFENLEYGVKPVFGVMYDPMDKLSIGLTVAHTWTIWSDTRAQHSSIAHGSADDAANTWMSIENSSTKRKYPWTASLGVAVFPTSTLLLSGDFIYYTGTNEDTLRDRKATWDLSLGAEYYFNSSWAMRGGLFTDNANTPKIDQNKADQDSHVDMYGASLSFSHFTKNSGLTVGASYQYGTGKSQVLAGSLAQQDTTMQSLTLFLSGNYSY
jgi:long-chain fatty acid transport protein